jgi:hypothetical protein
LGNSIPDEKLKPAKARKKGIMKTANEAKKIIAAKLNELGLPAYKLSAKTVDFTDLARAQKLFVKINGWKPSPLWDDLQKTAKENGFLITD